MTVRKNPNCIPFHSTCTFISKGMAISLLPFLIVLSSATFSSSTWDLALPPLSESQQPESQITKSQLTESQVAKHFKSWANKGTARTFLKAHNELRANYGVKPLRWDRSLARQAWHWAFQMHNACSLTHSQTHNGENLFVGLGKWTIKEAVEEWAKERFNYHWKDNSCNPNKMCGHFTQMIWAKTEAVGCAKIRCNATFVFVTCDYHPRGNIHGHWPIENHQKFEH